jgi:hypothetical protein
LLKQEGYHVIPPGDWRLSIPAKDLLLDGKTAKRLQEGYNTLPDSSPLTRKSFASGELTIGDIAKDFKYNRKSFLDFYWFGKKSLADLEEALEKTGALDRV